MSQSTNNAKALSWTQKQRSFLIGWRAMKDANTSWFQPCGLWPEENTEVLKAVEIPRKRYYAELNRRYFTQPEIILELGADLRMSWTDSIDSTEHVILRSSWSQREAHPKIWQIPLDELISVLDSPQWSWLAKRVTTIVMENTLNCLEQSVLLRLIRFTRKYTIRIIALKHRPLSAPCLSQLRASGRSQLVPERECPSIVLGAEQILYLLFSTPQKQDVNRILYLYRPPTGEPIVVFKWLPKSEEGLRRYRELKREEQLSNGAVVVLEVSEGVLGNRAQLDGAKRRLVVALLSLRSRGKSSYRAHMMREASKGLTLVEAWALSLMRLTKEDNRELEWFHDSVGEASTKSIVHTADGELIDPDAFIHHWRSSGFSQDVLTRYAYGLMGEAEDFGLSVRRATFGAPKGTLFQSLRIVLN